MRLFVGCSSSRDILSKYVEDCRKILSDYYKNITNEEDILK